MLSDCSAAPLGSKSRSNTTLPLRIEAAFIPMPIASLLMAIGIFNLNSRGSIPVLLTAVTAHILFVGIGVPQKLLSLGKKKQ